MISSEVFVDIAALKASGTQRALDRIETRHPYPWVKGKVERSISYIRENFWRGYAFSSIAQANLDIMRWKRDVADRRVHGTYRQPVLARWEEEVPHLGELPPSEYDTSLKFFRKVYKDCLLSCGGNRYYVPPEVVGKKVLLKVKGNHLSIYDDATLLKQYQISDEKGKTLSIPKARFV